MGNAKNREAEQFYEDIREKGDKINDLHLWRRFLHFVEKEESLEFIGLSSENSGNRNKLLKKIEKKVNVEIKRLEDDSCQESTKKSVKRLEFQFHFRPFYEDMLELWKKLLKAAIVFLKQNDRREKIHDSESFGVDELYEYFKKFSSFEEVLYENVKYYRDHVFHVLRVFFLGLVILFEYEYNSKKKRFFCDEVLIYDEILNKNIDDVASQIFNRYKDKFKEFESFNIHDSSLDLNEKSKIPFHEEIVSKDEKIAMWTIISLTHDLGYPLEKLGVINTKVREMLSAFGRSHIQDIEITFPQQGQFINDFVLKFIASRVVFETEKFKKNEKPKIDIEIEKDSNEFYVRVKKEKPDNQNKWKLIRNYWDLIIFLIIKEKNLKSNLYIESNLHIQSKYWLKFSRAFEDYNHSIISCILLMKYLVYFLESDYLLDEYGDLSITDQRQYQIRREILRSIAFHNCDNIYHLKTNNFGFLLTIIDDLQCWGRPSGRISTHGLMNWEVRIIDISENNIAFTIFIKEEYIEDEEFKQIFLSHCKKYTKIFRGAVGGYLKNFSMSFYFIKDHQKKRNNSEELVLLMYRHSLPENKAENRRDIKHPEFYKVAISEICYDGNKYNWRAKETDFHEYLKGNQNQEKK